MHSLDNWDQQDLNLWRNLFSEYSVVQAALLIVGASPSRNQYVLTESPDFRPFGFEAAFMALKQDIMNKNDIKATIRNHARIGSDYEYGWGMIEKGEDVMCQSQVGLHQTESDTYLHSSTVFVYRCEPNWELTTIRKENLLIWLEERNIKPAFFFSEKMGDQKEQSNLKPDYIDKEHPRYSMRLHAAVSAWEAMRDESLTKNKNPKDAMTDWIQENFKDLSPNAAKEAAAIANWFKDGLNNKKE